MLFSTYENLIDTAYGKCHSALAQLDSLDRSFEQKDCVAKEILAGVGGGKPCIAQKA